MRTLVPIIQNDKKKHYKTSPNNFAGCSLKLHPSKFMGNV